MNLFLKVYQEQVKEFREKFGEHGGSWLYENAKVFFTQSYLALPHSRN